MHVFRYLIELTLHFKRKYLEKTPTVNGSYWIGYFAKSTLFHRKAVCGLR